MPSAPWRQPSRLLEHLFRPGAHAVVLGQIAPADGAGAVEEELGGAGDVGAGEALLLMDEIEAEDHLGARIGEEGERVAGLAGLFARDGGSVDADRDRADAEGFEFGETLLNTP